MSRPGFVDSPVGRSSAIDLSRLLDQQTPLSWFEAVAIVQELCDVALHGSGPAPPASLELSDVLITSDGGVEVRGSAAQRAPTVAQAAHVLLALIEGTQALPVQLRLLALQEVSPTPACSTLREFSARLAPFERPNRRATIKEVHGRFAQLPARDAATPLPEAPRTRPSLAAARAPWWRSRRLRTVAASAALLVAAAVAVMWLWRVVEPLISDRGRTDGRRQRGRRGHAVAVRRGTNLGDGQAHLESGVVSTSASGSRRACGRPTGCDGGCCGSAGRGPSAVAGRRLERAGPRRRPRAPSVPDETVYSAADADVVRPVLVHPHLPTTPRAGVRAEDLPQVEVVVSPEGEVESVKLVTPQAGVKPGMMLMALKAWRFSPATRGGRPVRYRLVVPLTNQ